MSVNTRWSMELAEQKIKELISKTEIDHFPTHSEIDIFFNNKGLSKYISTHGGTKEWAKKFNMKIKECDSDFGDKMEIYAISDIKNKTGFDSIQTKPRYPYDLVTNEHIKIDVKSAFNLKDREYDTYVFNLEKKEPTCDIYLFYCMHEIGNPLKTFIIPSCYLKGMSQLGIGELSKWDCYQDKWEFIEEYSKFYTQILSKKINLGRRRSK